MSHWFDGFSQVHRFEMSFDEDSQHMEVHYNSRLICEEHIEQMRETGKLPSLTFGNKRDPCESFFQKAQSSFKAALAHSSSSPSSDNIGVTVSVDMPGNPGAPRKTSNDKSVQTLHTKTDAALYQAIDPETLEPIGIAQQKVLHPELKGPLSASHAKSDPETGDVFNFNLDLGPRPVYKIFQVSAATGKTKILATIYAAPAYLHSLFITADHVILCVWNSFFGRSGASILWEQNILDAISPFNDSKPANWYVIDRKHDRGLLATYESPAFFCFHTINAWTEPSPTEPEKVDIIADLSAYENLDVLKKFYYENLLSTADGYKAYQGNRGDSARSVYRRYRLPAVPTEPGARTSKKKAVVEFTAPFVSSPELPTFNGKYTTKPHRYTYGIVDRGLSTFVDGLVKYDSESKAHMYWEQHGHTPGEAIFVADPEGKDEDDGVLLSVVLDGNGGKSYLLCLDAKSMKEIGKAHVDGVVGFGFHGTHAPANGKALDY